MLNLEVNADVELTTEALVRELRIGFANRFEINHGRRYEERKDPEWRSQDQLTTSELEEGFGAIDFSSKEENR
jgi:hypothetical protein